MPPPPPDTARTILGICILLLYFYTSPDASSNPAFGIPSPRERLEQSIARQHHALDVLNTTAWGDFNAWGQEGKSARWGVNLTGFRESDAYMWENLGPVKQRAKALGPEAGMAEGSVVYENVTGVVLGKWVRNKAGLGGDKGWDTGKPPLNLSEIAPEAYWAHGFWNRNITGEEGNVMLRVDETDQARRQLVYNATGLGDAVDTDVQVVEASSTLTIEDESHGGDGWEIRLHGVHWPKQGAMIMTTTSEKFAGIYGLPHLVIDEKEYLSSQKLLNRTLGEALERRENQLWGDAGDPWASDDPMPVPHCEYVMYLQVHPVKMEEIHQKIDPAVKEDLASEIAELERELRFPLGAPIIRPPPLTMSMLIFSPDCGFILESKGPPTHTPVEGMHLRGLKQEVYTVRVKHWSLIWALALICQMLLTRLQMRETSTPSTISRISLYAVGMMAAADGILFGCLLVLAASVPGVFPTATLAAFAVSMCLGLEVRFVANVYKVQEPERIEAERARAAEIAAHVADFRARRTAAAIATSSSTPSEPGAASLTAPVITAAGADTIPVSDTIASPNNTATSANSEPPIVVPSDQDVDAAIAEAVRDTLPAPVNAGPQPLPGSRTHDIATTYGQFLMLFMCFFFLTVNSASWPSILRKIYLNIVGVVYLSFWCPQIYRNVIRNCRKAFLWKFVLGQSVLRIIPFAYFYLKEDNVLFAEKSGFSMLLLGGWLWIQIWALVAQEVLGPRFCIPGGWLPEAWDYHPVLREDDVEGGGLPIGLVQAPGSPSLERVRTGEEGRKKSDDHTRSVDCAICMQRLDVPVVPPGGDASNGVVTGAGGVTGMLARRFYMVTPCRHVFHSVCLEGWMRFRLQCPICRENLPPL